MTEERKQTVRFWSPAGMMAFFYMIHWDTELFERIPLAVFGGFLVQVGMMIFYAFAVGLAKTILGKDGTKDSPFGDGINQTALIAAVLLAMFASVAVQVRRSQDLRYIAQCVGPVLNEGYYSPKEAVMYCNDKREESSDDYAME